MFNFFHFAPSPRKIKEILTFTQDSTKYARTGHVSTLTLSPASLHLRKYPTCKRQHVLCNIVYVYILGSLPSQFLNIVFVDRQGCGCSLALSLIFFNDSIFGFVVAVTCHIWASKDWSISKQHVLSCQFWFSFSSF